MERVLFRFTKGEPVKFVGHLDLMRVVERAMRRSGFPIGYSQGFNPRPRMAFASALTLGATSDCELCQLDLAEPMENAAVAAALAGLQAQLPAGMIILKAWPVPLERRSPYLQVNAATYELTMVGEQVVERANHFLQEGPFGSRIGAWNARAASESTDRTDRMVLTIELPVGERDGVRIRDLIAEMEAANPGSRVTRLHRVRLRCELEPAMDENTSQAESIDIAAAA